MAGRVAVTFEPSGLIADVEPGTTVLDAARSCGITIAAPCGGRGVCGSCGVRIVSGELAEPDEAEVAGLRRAPSGVRLACRARISAEVTLRPLVATVAAEVAPLRSDGELIAAVDLGTTTVAAAVVGAQGQRERATALVANRQQAWGSDVLSRVSASIGGAADELRQAAVGSVLDALGSAAAGRLERITRVVVAGNTTMTSLLAGVDVSSLASHPFTVPSIPDSLSELRVTRYLPSAEVVLVPPISAFVGGDALAGLVYTGMLRAEAPQLLVDLGTNAEIALVRGKALYVASAAAGPAFEGVGVGCGGPATPGAVTGVAIGAGGELDLETVGDEPPTWFAGSGLISVLALLRRSGHLDVGGRLEPAGPLAARFHTDGEGVSYVSFGDEDARELMLSQLDVRAVQLAKAAVRVGISRVLAEAQVGANELQAIYIAGAFGGGLVPEDLVTLGVIPAVDTEVVHYVGNASLEGALEMAANAGIAEEASVLTRMALHVELAADPGFGSALMHAVALEPFDV